MTLYLGAKLGEVTKIINNKYLITHRNIEDDRPRHTSQIVHYDTSEIKLFPTGVSVQHEPKASDLITLVKKTFFARVSYEVLYHEV